MVAMNGQQAGDPKKLALAVLELVQHRYPPFRYTAGQDAVAAMNLKLENMKQELDKWGNISLSHP